MEEVLVKEIEEFFEDKGIDKTNENIKSWYEFALEQIKNPYYEQPCENCDNPWCKDVNRIWYCIEQR